MVASKRVGDKSYYLDISKNHALSKPEISQQVLDYAPTKDGHRRGD
jgi:hypothetical protein